MSTPFQNRVFGCAIVKAVNANYNADFTHAPRTLPDGTAYATDKAFKYLIKNHIREQHPAEKVLYTKTFNKNLQPRTLDEAYNELYNKDEQDKLNERDAKKNKIYALEKLLGCIDVRLFGATFAVKKTNISIHGPVQISHGLNRFPESMAYSEQIQSPFRNSSEKSADSDQSTLGTQMKLAEGHFVHHFSINPQNLAELSERIEGRGNLTEADIEKLKAGMCGGATYYDSSAKSGVDNELLLWVQLKPDSRLVLPSFVELVSVTRDGSGVHIDLSRVSALLEQPHVEKAVEKVELYCEQSLVTLQGKPANAEVHSLTAMASA